MVALAPWLVPHGAQHRDEVLSTIEDHLRVSVHEEGVKLEQEALPNACPPTGDAAAKSSLSSDARQRRGGSKQRNDKAARGGAPSPARRASAGARAARAPARSRRAPRPAPGPAPQPLRRPRRAAAPTAPRPACPPPASSAQTTRAPALRPPPAAVARVGRQTGTVRPRRRGTCCGAVEESRLNVGRDQKPQRFAK